MPDRPAIPAEIQRQVLTEAGHRCAVCGESCPLEKAHIIRDADDILDQLFSAEVSASPCSTGR